MRTLLLALFAVSIGLIGCGKKEREKSSVRVRGGTEATTQPNTGDIAPGSPYQRVFGNVSGYSTNNVKSLVSATMDPDNDMELPIAGIAMSGDIQLNGSTQNVLALGSTTATIKSGSEFAIFIVDNLTATQNAPTITIGFKPGQNGYQIVEGSKISNGGQFTITFRDQYGDVIVTGQYQSSQTTGTIAFKNNGGSNPGQTITLGSFTVPTCGFFHCQ